MLAEVKQFIFFDFEMLCSEHGMPFASMEAIRLGAVKYDLETEEITFFDSYIKPEQTEPLSDFCKNLTCIDDEDLAKANSFPYVLNEFICWIGGNAKSRFFSWSSNDLSRLQLDANRHNISASTISSIVERYSDFQKTFSKRVSKINPSVENALALYGLDFKGDMHNPMYDAYNTLRVYIAFSKELVKTDVIMLNHFVFTNKNIELNENLNEDIKQQIQQDLQTMFNNIQPICNIRHANKLLKRTGKLVKKYENVLINRSRIFEEDVLLHVRLIIEFYKELISSYNEHFSCGCKIFILHEHMTTPLKKIVVAA